MRRKEGLTPFLRPNRATRCSNPDPNRLRPGVVGRVHQQVNRVHQRSETFVRDERLLKQEEENLEGDVDLRLQEVEKCRVISKRSQSSPPSHHHLRSNEVVTGANVGSYKEILEIRGLEL
ncbi:hypothetical protein GQ457_16G021160 [Hibiscus cannabinus]